jgi:hypothetical protein
VLFRSGTDNLVLYGSTGGTAVTFSQATSAATFAGAVTVGGAVTLSTSVAFLSATSGKAIISYNSVGGLNFTGAGSVNDLTIYNKDGNVVVENPTGTTTLKLGGALRVNNAYVAGAVVGTGSITIQDSTGTTYRIPVLV